MVKENKNNLKILSGLQDIVSEYDAFIIDLWGVVHNGVVAYPGVVACLNNLIADNKQIIFMTNAPRPNKVILQQLLDLKINANLDMMLTSGDTARSVLKKTLINKPSTRYYHLGKHRNPDILIDLELNLVDDFTKSDIILLTVYLEEHENLEQFDDILKQAATMKIPVICPNPDRVAIHGSKNIYCAGFLADKYEKLGGIVEYYGKPHLPIYSIALDRLLDQGVFNKKRILMVGDTLATDIQGAKNAGIDSALVLTGNISNLLKNLKSSELEALENLFINNNVFPNHILHSLR